MPTPTDVPAADARAVINQSVSTLSPGATASKRLLEPSATSTLYPSGRSSCTAMFSTVRASLFVKTVVKRACAPGLSTEDTADTAAHGVPPGVGPRSVTVKSSSTKSTFGPPERSRPTQV